MLTKAPFFVFWALSSLIPTSSIDQRLTRVDSLLSYGGNYAFAHPTMASPRLLVCHRHNKRWIKRRKENHENRIYHHCFASKRKSSSFSSPLLLLLLSSSSSEEGTPISSIVPILSPDPSCNPDQLGGTALAYIGDSVYELFVRSRYVWPNRRTSDLQNIVVGTVRAEYQSLLLRKLLQSQDEKEERIIFVLDQKERMILNRGRNAASKTSSRRQGGDPTLYQDSTALEALLGYLYISNVDRCAELLRCLGHLMDQLKEE